MPPQALWIQNVVELSIPRPQSCGSSTSRTSWIHNAWCTTWLWLIYRPSIAVLHPSTPSIPQSLPNTHPRRMNLLNMLLQWRFHAILTLSRLSVAVETWTKRASVSNSAPYNGDRLLVLYSILCRGDNILYSICLFICLCLCHRDIGEGLWDREGGWWCCIDTQCSCYLVLLDIDEVWMRDRSGESCHIAGSEDEERHSRSEDFDEYTVQAISFTKLGIKET